MAEEEGSVTLILFTTIAPHPLMDGLLLAGFCVFEALSISEVFSLVEKHPDAVILIDACSKPSMIIVTMRGFMVRPPQVLVEV